MFRFFSALDCLRSRRKLRRPLRRFSAGTRPAAVEQLEVRQLLTAVFNTQFGAETLIGTAPFSSVMNNVTVHVLFWGNTWDTATGPSSATAFNEAKAIINSTYLKGLTEYGSNGVVSSIDSYVDTASNPSSTFNPGVLTGSSLTEAQNELTAVVNAGNLAGPGSPANLNVAPIYFIITDPAHNGGTNGGYNTSGTVATKSVNICSMGTSLSGTQVSAISFGNTFSHEMAEHLTDDSDPGGARFNLPAGMPASLGFSGAQQVADGEAEPNGQAHYTLPLNGAFVQPFWSANFNAFIVPDGNSEQFTLNPIWNTTTNVFSGQFNLVINGDQLANKDDALTVGVDPTGTFIQLTLNGQTDLFTAGEVKSITFNGLTGNDKLTLDLTNGNPLNAGATLQFNGGGGSNTLVGANTSNDWEITGADSGTLNTSTTFSGVQNLTGGTSSDQFNFSTGGSLAGNIDGNGGAVGRISYASFAGPVLVNLQTDTANGIGGTFSNINSFVGSSSSDKIIGPNSATTWTLTGANAGSAGGTSFSSFENLVGGSGADSFAFQNGGSISGNIDGGTGSNTLDYSASSGPVTVDLQTSTATGISGTFSNIASFVGSSGSDLLIGPDAGAFWTLGGANSGSVAGATFSSFENLLGGSGADSFVFQNGGSVSGNIDGGLGSNALDYSLNAGPVTVNLQTTTATDIGGTFSNIGTFFGSLGSDTLIGPDGGATWALSGLDSGSVAGVTYSSFENLTGGSGADSFAFQPGGGVSGNIDGGGGTDTLDYSLLAGPVTVNLQTGTANNIGGTFGNVENFIGSASANDTLIGPDATWTITGPNSGTVNGFSFSSFENLTGGAGPDQFIFANGGSVSGNIDGGAGDNTLDFSTNTGPVTVNLQNHTATFIGGTFSNIDKLIGSQGSDLLVGPDTDTVWTLTGLNAGTVAGYTFSSFENLLGGAGSDRFVFQTGGGVSGVIDGGGGTNFLDYSNYAGDLFVDLPLGISTGVGGSIKNIQGIIGGLGNDLFVGDDNNNIFVGGAQRNILIGGKGADQLTGGKGDNILIAGTTAYDRNVTALMAIMKEWTRQDLSFEQRIADLISDAPPSRALNGPFMLNKKTVFDDTSADVLNGVGFTWFFEDRQDDTLTGRLPQDHITGL